MLTNKGEKENGRNQKTHGGGGATSSQASNLIQNFRKRLNSVNLNKKIKAFTLAEVLITLAIIGVVAALTIPTVITNYQKKMYVTQLKKSYNNLSNGFRTIMANEGVTKLTDTTLWSKMPINGFSQMYNKITKPEYEEFLKEFTKIFKVAGVASYGRGNTDKKYDPAYNGLNGASRVIYLSSAIYLADGTLLSSYLLKDPSVAYCGTKECSSLKEYQETRNTKTKLYSFLGMIAIDVNGQKGPNTMGRDLFQFYLGDDGMLYPYGGADYAVYSGCEYDNLETCKNYWKNEGGEYPCTKSSDGNGCTGRIMEEGWEMKY